MDTGDSKRPKTISEAETKINDLENLVKVLARRNNDHIAGMKMALRIVMVLLRDHVPDDETVLFTTEELVEVEEQFKLDLHEVAVDEGAQDSLIAVSLLKLSKQFNPPFEFVDAVGTPLAAASKRSNRPN